MRFLLVLLFCQLVSTQLFAQNPLTLTIDTNYQIYTGIQAIQEFKIKIHDASGVQRIITWIRKDECQMPDGWKAFVCDCNQCYNEYDYSKECTMANTCSVIFTYNFNFGATITNHTSTFFVYDALDSANTLTSISMHINNDCPLSTDNNQYLASDLQIFPNPSFDILNYSITNNADSLVIELIDFLGRPILKQSSQTATGKIEIANLSKGLYFFTVRSKNNLLLGARKFYKN